MLVENPPGSKAWSETALADIRRKLGREAVVQGCRVGLKAENGKLMGKRWRFATNDRPLQEALAPFSHCLGGHTHARCEGRVRTEASGSYPRELCMRLLRAALQPKTSLLALVAEAAEQDMEEEPPEPEKPTEGGVAGTKVSAEERKRIQSYLHLVHVNLGHPSRKVLVRMLRTRGASPVVQAHAREFSCDLCDALKGPTPSPADGGQNMPEQRARSAS